MISNQILRALLLCTAVTLAFSTSVEAQLFKKASESAIFKSGQPQKVKETSYIIQDGNKVEQAKKRSRLLNFPKRSKETTPEPPAIVTPDASYPEVPDTPTFDPLPGATATAPVLDQTVITPEPIVAVPQNPKKERRLKLPVPSIPKLRRNRDTVPAGPPETLINDGGVLVAADQQPASVSEFTPESASGPAKPPRKEGDSVIYDDWSDVTATKRSAADQIVGQLRAQEAAHSRKQAAAKRAMESQMRQAEAQMKKAAEARRQAMMQQQAQQRAAGGGIPGGIPGMSLPPGIPGGGF